MNIKEELIALVKAFDSAGIPYALCGGMAMAAHGWPRSTMDIELLVPQGRIDAAKQVANGLGFSHEPGTMALEQGRIHIVRLVKFAGEDFLPLDLIQADQGAQQAWNSREKIMTDHGPICLVSKDGLIAMKKLRGSGTDHDDIEKLSGGMDAKR